MDFNQFLPLLLVNSLLWISAKTVDVPDLQWSFERSCHENCNVCVDSSIPDGVDYRLTDGCLNDTSVKADDLVGGFIGNALSLHGIEAAVKHAEQSCITDLDRKVPLLWSPSTLRSICQGLTLSFWLNLESLPTKSRAFVFRTATYETGLYPTTAGIGISVTNDGKLHGQVQTPGVHYEAKTSANAVVINEWIHVILSWSTYPLNIVLNGSSSAAETKTVDSPKGDRNGSIILGQSEAINFTIDEIKIWYSIGNNEEIFRDALYPPTEPPTTTEETVATEAPTTTSSTTKSTTTTTVGRTLPYYYFMENPILEKISKNLYENQKTNEQKDFNTSASVVNSSIVTIGITSTLVEALQNENIELDHRTAISLIASVSVTTNHILAEENAVVWSAVDDQTDKLNEIIENADNVTNTILESMIHPENLTEVDFVKTESVSVTYIPSSSNNSILISASDDVTLAIPRTTVSSLSQDNPVFVATNIHSGAQECYQDLPPSEVDIFTDNAGETSSSSSNVHNSGLDVSKFQIITEIVSINIKPKPINKEILLIFRHIRDISHIKKFTLYCAYIDKTTGRWTNNFCNITETNATHTKFVTNHLTNFAILMQVVEFEISEQHRKNLGLITYIGLSISIFCLILSLCVFALVNNVRNQRTERYHLHANLALGMLLGQVTFLAGSGYPPGTDSCKATAILLHFFYLATFTWMLVEGFHLYNLVVKVFRSSESKLGYYYMLGWGLPLMICVTSVAAAFEGYGERINCWLDVNNSRVIWAFVGPVLFVILVNSIILAKVTMVISSLAKSRDNCLKCMTDTAAIAVCVKAVAVLMPILGMTWIFGVFAVNENLIAFQYIFAILNSLQGFFLFMFHCVLNSETRSSLMYRAKALRTDASSKSSGSSKVRRSIKVDGIQNADRNSTVSVESRTAWKFDEPLNQRNSIHEIPGTSRTRSLSANIFSDTEEEIRLSNDNFQTNRRISPNTMTAW